MRPSGGISALGVCARDSLKAFRVRKPCTMPMYGSALSSVTIG
jgi:hypothetical protein